MISGSISRFRRHVTVYFCLPFLIAALCSARLIAEYSQHPLRDNERSTDSATSLHGAVASESRQCSEIGAKLITQGGNAADAIVGTVLCIGVVNSHHSGIGGGGFALARHPNGSVQSIDFRETAPAAASPHMFEGNELGSIAGGLASGIPSELRGLEYIHSTYGQLPRRKVFDPAIRLARLGFRVSADLANAMDFIQILTGDDFLQSDPSWAQDFAPNGTRVGSGDIVYRKRYANTLELIAERGPNAFYSGHMAEAMIGAIRSRNGSMLLQDLQGYRIALRNPVSIAYKYYNILACGAPASGAVTLSALKILDGFLEKIRSNTLRAHRLIEAMKFAYGKRAYLGDPDVKSGISVQEDNMLSDQFAKTTRDRISDSHTLNLSAYDPGGYEILNDHGTSHIVATDSSGLAFSLTTTVNLFFGSRLMVPETGVILNNEMNDFSIPRTKNFFGFYPSPNNYARPFARPLSSISPIMILHQGNQSLHSLLGASGGSRIISTTIQNVIHILNDNLTMAAALARPRLHDQLLPNEVNIEVSDSWSSELAASLEAKGHNIVWNKTAGSSGQGVRIYGPSPFQFEAAAEPRQSASGGSVV